MSASSTLMGGEPREQWYLEPGKPYIVIGTQDMLLSRALNRGYGSSPAMWPVEYGLLNNDCLWIMDEVQLMANGLPTSTQLAGLRRKLGAYGPSHSIWMSATVKPDWLATIDHSAPDSSEVLTLGADDMANTNLARRHDARKILTESSARTGGSQNATDMADLISENHERGSLTLVIVNTVERAQNIYARLTNPRQFSLDAEKILVHSRFRSPERAQKNAAITEEVDPSGPGKIVVATQAVEAGVDISARTLITELAPWASMVQRFGRCNRAGEFEQGSIIWVDVGDRKQDAAPYEAEDLETARAQLKSLEGESVGPADLETLGDVIEDADHLTVIRRRDVIGLFDNTPDLSGSYVDVSQYVRGDDERTVTVFWRNLNGAKPESTEPKMQHFETVSVPLGKSIEDYAKKNDRRRLWRWDFVDSDWERVQARQVQPSATLMLDAALGGYSSGLGWNPSDDKSPVELQGENANGTPEDGQNTDPNSTSQRRWVTLAHHSRHVESRLNEVLGSVSQWLAEPKIVDAVSLAALYHDVGKAHPKFQEMLRSGSHEGNEPPDGLLAKSRGKGNKGNKRPHFRHEVGSALAILQHTTELEGRPRDLAAYLAAAHHGKVRLGIRSLPERRPNGGIGNPNPDYLLGYPISEQEKLPAVDLGDGLAIDETDLDMSIAQIGLDENGQRSWLDRTLGLLEWLGPFQLAYLESIVRAADMHASKKESEVSEE